MSPDQFLVIQLCILGLLTLVLLVVWGELGPASIRRLPGTLRGVVGVAAIAGMLGVLTAPRFALKLFGPAPATGKLADFTWPLVATADGTKTTLEAFKGKAIFLNLFATWCGPCMAEMPSIEKLQREFVGKEADVVFLFISLDQDATVLKKYLEARKSAIPVYIPAGPLPKDFQTRGIPATFIIRKDGAIQQSVEGGKDWSNPETVELLKSLAKS